MFLRFLLSIVAATTLWILPCPEGLNLEAWHLFAIFVGTVLGLIAKPLPMGALALMGLLAAALTGCLSIQQGLSGYGYNVTWLIVFVFFVARGFIKTKLGLRLGYFFVSVLGKRTLGLAYGLVATELLIAPLVPSNGARAGGIMYPLLHSICDALGSQPNKGTRKKLGSYLAQVCVQGNHITSAMFLTAMAANPLIQVASRVVGVELTWGLWFKASCVPGLISLLLVPLILYYIYPPELKVLPNAKAIAQEHLRALGKMSSKEYIMSAVFGCMLVLWIMGREWHIQTETTALLGVTLLLVTGVLSFDDILNEKEAWHTLLWLSPLVIMAENLQRLGFIGWFSEAVQTAVYTPHWEISLLLIVLVYFYSHYCFASSTAHVSAMFAAFLGAAVAVGAPPMLAVLTLAFASSLYACLTHYGSTAAAVLYAGNYVPIGPWWLIGAVMSIVYLVVWMGIGSLWWKVLQIW